MRRSHLVLLFVAGLLSLGGIALGLWGQARQTEPQTTAAEVLRSPEADRFEGSLMPAGVRAPDFKLRDQDNEPIAMRDLRGRPAIVTFLYTTCTDTCPAQAQQIKIALDRLGRREQVPALAIAVKPDTDTPASARHFLHEQGMTGRMDFVLGSRPQLKPVWKGFAIQPQLAHAEHQARVVLVDGRGFQRIGYPADQLTPERVAKDVRTLLAERPGAPGAG